MVRVEAGTPTVVEQYTYSPYGQIVYADVLDAEAPLSRVGFQGLFFDRFDTPRAAQTLAPAGGTPGNVSATPTGLYYARNRFYAPELGRFVTRDVNATALPIITALAFNAETLGILAGTFDAQSHYADGGNLYLFAGGNPIKDGDPLGLYYDPFEDVDAIIAGMWAERATAAASAMRFFEAVAEMAIRTAVEGLVVSLVPGGILLVSAYNMAEGIADVQDEGWTIGNALQIGLSAIPLLGAAGRAASWALSKAFSRFTREAAALSEASRFRMVGVCFTAGTLVATANGYVPIEKLHIGQRVLTTDVWLAPKAAAGDLGAREAVFGEPIDRRSTQVSSRSWRLVCLAMPNPACRADMIRIETLRPLDWVEQAGCRPGTWIWFTLPEMGLAGPALVASVDPCPPIEDGPGRVVLSTVTHLNERVLRIWLAGLTEPLEPTWLHRLYSTDRRAWVLAGELEVGEHVWALSGPAEIVRIEHIGGARRVYNLEVETEHCYLVSTAGVLSHNVNPCALGIPADSDLARAMARGMRVRSGARGFEEIAKHLEKCCGVSRVQAGARIHRIKSAWGLGGADDCYFGFSGDVYHPYTGERIGTLTGG